MPITPSTPSFDLAGAISALPSTGGIIEVPTGTHIVDTVDLTKPNVTIRLNGATLEKATTTVTHMFTSVAGTADGFSVIGPGLVDMKTASFTLGNTVSFFFGSRASNLLFSDVYFKDGIEDGLKFYGCQHVKVERCRFENFKTNGIEFHTPTVENDSHTGSVAARDSAYLAVSDCYFLDIDDGLLGAADGQAIAISAADDAQVTRDVVIDNCIAEDCIRGFHSEFNQAGLPGLRITYSNCQVNGARSHGFVFNGVHGGVITGCQARNCGVTGSASADLVGFIVGGSADPQSKDVVVGDCVAYDDRGGSAVMEHGFMFKQAVNITVSDIRSRGATESEYEVQSTVTSSRIVPDQASCRVERTDASNQTLTNDTWESVLWTEEVYDPLDMHDGSNTERFAEDMLPGEYEVVGSIVFLADATGQRGVRVEVIDGGTTTAFEAQVDAAAVDDTSIPFVCRVRKAHNGYIRVQAWQNSGGATPTVRGADRCFCSVRLVGGNE